MPETNQIRRQTSLTRLLSDLFIVAKSSFICSWWLIESHFNILGCFTLEKSWQKTSKLVTCPVITSKCHPRRPLKQSRMRFSYLYFYKYHFVTMLNYHNLVLIFETYFLVSLFMNYDDKESFFTVKISCYHGRSQVKFVEQLFFLGRISNQNLRVRNKMINGDWKVKFNFHVTSITSAICSRKLRRTSNFDCLWEHKKIIWIYELVARNWS